MYDPLRYLHGSDAAETRKRTTLDGLEIREDEPREKMMFDGMPVGSVPMNLTWHDTITKPALDDLEMRKRLPEIHEQKPVVRWVLLSFEGRDNFGSMTVEYIDRFMQNLERLSAQKHGGTRVPGFLRYMGNVSYTGRLFDSNLPSQNGWVVTYGTTCASCFSVAHPSCSQRVGNLSPSDAPTPEAEVETRRAAVKESK